MRGERAKSTRALAGSSESRSPVQRPWQKPQLRPAPCGVFWPSPALSSQAGSVPGASAALNESHHPQENYVQGQMLFWDRLSGGCNSEAELEPGEAGVATVEKGSGFPS